METSFKGLHLFHALLGSCLCNKHFLISFSRALESVPRIALMTA